MSKIFLYFQAFLCTGVWAQESKLYPETFNLFFNSMSVVNPAVVAPEGQAIISSHFKFRTGAFKKITTYAFIAEAMKRRPNGQCHLGRVSFFNENEGPYITRPRAYLNYAYQIPFSSNTSLSAGLALGIAGIYFTAPSPTAFGSSTVPDGSAGLVLNSNRFVFGVAALQILNAITSPIQSRVRFQRFYNLFSQFTVPINDLLEAKVNSLYRVMPARYDDFLLGSTLLYRKIFGLGSLINVQQGVCLYANVSVLNGEDLIYFSFGYNTPLFLNRVLAANSIEISASYTLE